MALTKIEDISTSSNQITNPSPVNASNITTQKNDRASNIKVLTSNSCEVATAVDGSPNVSGNTNNNNAGGGSNTESGNTVTKTIYDMTREGSLTFNENKTWGEIVGSGYNITIISPVGNEFSYTFVIEGDYITMAYSGYLEPYIESEPKVNKNDKFGDYSSYHIAGYEKNKAYLFGVK